MDLADNNNQHSTRTSMCQIEWLDRVVVDSWIMRKEDSRPTHDLVYLHHPNQSDICTVKMITLEESEMSHPSRITAGPLCLVKSGRHEPLLKFETSLYCIG